MPVNQTRSSASPNLPGSLAGPGPEARLYLKEQALDGAVELLFDAARRFWQAAAAPLEAHGLGPAHYRALAAIRRGEGLTVSALRARLGVTKQSLARVLNEVEAAGLILRAPGAADKRERRLGLTAAGRAAEAAVSAALREVLAGVFRQCGAEAVAGAREVLAAMAAPGDGDGEAAR